MLESYHGKWLVGVSTGPDSMALLRMCLEEQVPIVVGHVNYHHQVQAEQEEEFLRAFCMEKGIPLFVQNDSFTPTGNFEAEARTKRYEFFREVVEKEGLEGVLIAHQQDDHIETFLMQQAKGIIPNYWGLQTTAYYQTLRVERPLLSLSRKEILDYCEKKQIPYFLDETNEDTKYERNRIRKEVVEKMSDFERAMVLKEIEKVNAEWKERRCRVKTEIRNTQIELARYKSLPSLDRNTLLRMFLKENGITKNPSRKYLEEMDHILCEKKDFVLEIEGKCLTVEDSYFCMKEKPKEYSYTFKTLDELLSWKNKGPFLVQEGELGVYAVSLTEQDFPITIRNWKEGDQIQMRFGTKSIHRFFIDRHIPLWKRRQWPIMVDQNGNIIFVPELGCDVFHYSIKPSCCVVQYLNSEGA